MFEEPFKSIKHEKNEQWLPHPCFKRLQVFKIVKSRIKQKNIIC